MSVEAARSTAGAELPRTLNEALRPCAACLHLEPNSIPKLTTPVSIHQHMNGSASPRKYRLVAKLYESSNGHYILLNHDKLYSGSPIYLNLKNTSVQRLDNDKNILRFVSNNCDGMSLTFELPTKELVQKWLDVISPVNTCLTGSKSPVIPRSPLLPTLTEDEEE